MSREIERRLRNLELINAEKPTPEVRLEELVEKVKGFYPDEVELWAAMDRLNLLESSELEADIDEYSKTVTFITRELRRLQANAAQPSK
ncbi:hypothetical protein ISS40_07935 [Candidatus Bathyarchaeota archaeon]|nr:hypothetical protein [Candidatus Bathyarchaeota archaeon]